jgi:hypothetical protein
MTAVFPVPIIPRHRYAAFRHDVGSDLADTYDEWLKVVHKIRGDEFGPGETLVEVPVDRERFMAFCAATGIAPNGKTLLDFAITTSGVARA